jgi:hypothetical protein
MCSKQIGFICPLSKEDSVIRKRSDDIMDSIIGPVAKEFGYTIQRADKMSGNVVMEDIFQLLRESDIVIADLTELNPNVFYELGVRQAIKGKCINIICDNGGDDLPFDIDHYRAYRYKLKSTFKDADVFKNYIRSRIKFLEQTPWEPCISLNEGELAEIYNITLVSDFLKGTKEHYELARELFSEPCKSIFLMQRSSSLILNAERGWGAEATFLANLMPAIEQCGFFYHIITIEGIEAHFNRRSSVFPQFKDFAKTLDNINGNVAIKKDNKNNQIFYLRKLPKDEQGPLFKLDRQARILITEDYAGRVKTVIVQNLGDNQTCFLMQGPKAKDYLDTCVDFYNTCELVEWTEIDALYKKYEKIEENRGKHIGI